MTHVAYAVGLATDDYGRVVLIRKNRPEWQAGLLNGVGGHIEPGETPEEAMSREWAEETGGNVPADRWRLVVRIEHANASIFVFATRLPSGDVDRLRTTTDEEVEVHEAAGIIRAGVAQDATSTAIPNLPWLLALALYDGDVYDPIVVFARSAETAGRRP